MPHLLLFAACEKVINDRDTGFTSLISLLEAVTITIPQGPVPVPHDLEIKMHWSLFSLWRKIDGDPPQCMQQISVVRPDGGIFRAYEQSVDLARAGSKIITNLPLFPAGIAGTVLTKVKLRLEPLAEWKDIAEYPITMVHLRA